MGALEAFLRDYLQFNYSVSEAIDRYAECVSPKVKYMYARSNFASVLELSFCEGLESS